MELEGRQGTRSTDLRLATQRPKLTRYPASCRYRNTTRAIGAMWVARNAYSSTNLSTSQSPAAPVRDGLVTTFYTYSQPTPYWTKPC
jgi:hypothetical protein